MSTQLKPSSVHASFPRLALAALAAATALVVAACGSSSPGGSGGSSSAGSNASSASAPATGQSSGVQSSAAQSSAASSTGVPASSASTATAAALTPALTTSYQAETTALATYRNVVARLGSVGPFPQVASAEEQHVSAVTTLLNSHGITVPAAATGQPSPATLTAACSLGVTIEQNVIAFYNSQLPQVAAYPDVTTVFRNLLAASRDNHLPAFQHCA